MLINQTALLRLLNPLCWSKLVYAFTILCLCGLVGAAYCFRPFPRSFDTASITANLSPGDVIFVRGQTLRGMAVRMADSGFGYSHVGIVAPAEQGPCIIHAAPAADALLEQPVEAFLADPKISAVAVYRFSDTGVAASAAELAEQFYREKLPFDDAFRKSTPQSLYCTELVWRAYLGSGINLCLDRFDEVATLFASEPVILPESLLHHSGMHCIFQSN
ncbi:MAG: hypothetical protein JW739_08770 [Opitutales bacterium]|nr:hypothetical protein [Opitutales bacterium]